MIAIDAVVDPRRSHCVRVTDDGPGIPARRPAAGVRQVRSGPPTPGTARRRRTGPASASPSPRASWKRMAARSRRESPHHGRARHARDPDIPARRRAGMSGKTRVLVVDDEPAILRFLKPALEANDYEMSGAGSVAEATKRIAADAPDIVLLDLGLPDGDGKDVIRRVREWSDVPIVVLSARDREAEKIEALDLGADDYVNKPFGCRRTAGAHAHGVAPSDAAQGRNPGPARRQPRNRQHPPPGHARGRRDQADAEGIRAAVVPRPPCRARWSRTSRSSPPCGARRIPKTRNICASISASCGRRSSSRRRSAHHRHRARHRLPDRRDLTGVPFVICGRAASKKPGDAQACRAFRVRKNTDQSQTSTRRVL